MEKERILSGRWSQKELDTVLNGSSQIKHTGTRIDFISRRFLDIAYKESTLIGDANTPEVFVINLEGVDCFTFIDYVEAMRLSASFSEFKENLKKVRYRYGKAAFKNRNHFFSDWIEFNSDIIDDITRQIGGQKTETVRKRLNEKEDGTFFLKDIKPVQRTISYIPSEAVDDSVMNKLQTGDYIGIYSITHGLDVSHVGIFIKDGDRIYFRHASSAKRMVLDEDFKNYIADKPGLVILRPKD